MPNSSPCGTDRAHLHKGVARALLHHILAVARARRIQRINSFEFIVWVKAHGQPP
jgi:hypothetical protein